MLASQILDSAELQQSFRMVVDVISGRVSLGNRGSEHSSSSFASCSVLSASARFG